MHRRDFFHMPTPGNRIRALLIAAPLLTTLPLQAAVKDIYVECATSRADMNSGCCVPTDISITSESVIETEVQIRAITGSYHTTLFCARGSSATDRAYVVTYNTANGWTFAYGNTSKSSGVYAEAGRRYIVRATPDGLYVDGVQVIEMTAASFASPGKLCLFCPYTYKEDTDTYSYSTSSRAQANFWWFKIYGPDGNGGLTLEHELKPCQCTDGMIGLYDENTGSAWCNTSTSSCIGTFFNVPSGDAVALTNALNRIKLARGSGYYNGVFECRLAPGLYDLSGIYMDSKTHLLVSAISCKIYGTGQGPADTILLGEGSAGTHRILYLSTNNAGENSVSNLTVTGGYLTASAYGGGIVTSEAGKGSVFNCIITNNYAKGGNGNGGGGVWGARIVRNCLIADNRSNFGGGLRSCSFVEDCIISNNYASGYGGGISGGKTTTRCLIVDNRAQNHGGGKTEGVAIDCVFARNVARYGGNVGFGGGLHSAVATNCVFVGNTDGSGAYGSAASGSTLVGCTITNCVGYYSIFDRSSIVRCHVSDVGARANNSGFRVFGRYNGAVIYTNVNSIIENVALSNSGQRVAVVSTFVNCTIRNAKGNTTYGPLAENCTAVNTIISGCEPYDVTASTAPMMTNCLYQTASGTFAEGRLVDCVKGNPRYDLESDVPGAIRRSSPAYNAGLGDAWILDLVGETDFAGNPRVKFDSIDIGAIERQSNLLPGLRLSVQ